jgi:hypothetical protein
MVCLFILILNEICFKLTTDNNLALEELDPESLDKAKGTKPSTINNNLVCKKDPQ